MQKRIEYCLNFLVQGFFPLKIEVTQFPDGLRLKLLYNRLLFVFFVSLFVFGTLPFFHKI